MRALISILAIALIPAAAQAQFDLGPDEGGRYAACLERTGTEPVEAYEDALAWRSLGGGVQAEHCAAIALIRLGHEEEAASRLEALADEPAFEDAAMRAELLRQAGSAWLMAGQLDSARAAAGRAIEAAPDDAELYLLRAQAALDAEDYAAAEADLDTVVEAAPGQAAPLILRAHAYMGQGQLTAALEDAEAAVEADPANVDARLILGHAREAIRASSSEVAD